MDMFHNCYCRISSITYNVIPYGFPFKCEVAVPWDKFWFCFFPYLWRWMSSAFCPCHESYPMGLDRTKGQPGSSYSHYNRYRCSRYFFGYRKGHPWSFGITVSSFHDCRRYLFLSFPWMILLYMEKRWGQIDLRVWGPVPLGVPLIVGPAVLTTTCNSRQRSMDPMATVSSADLWTSWLPVWRSGCICRSCVF